MFLGPVLRKLGSGWRARIDGARAADAGISAVRATVQTLSGDVARLDKSRDDAVGAYLEANHDVGWRALGARLDEETALVTTFTGYLAHLKDARDADSSGLAGGSMWSSANRNDALSAQIRTELRATEGIVAQLTDLRRAKLDATIEAVVTGAEPARAVLPSVSELDAAKAHRHAALDKTLGAWSTSLQHAIDDAGHGLGGNFVWDIQGRNKKLKQAVDELRARVATA